MAGRPHYSTACSSTRVLGEPRLRHGLLRARQPRVDEQVAELVPVEPLEVGDPDEHGGVAAEMRRREVDPALVGEQQLLHVEIGRAEHEHVGHALARLRVDRVRSLRAVEGERLSLGHVRGPAVLRHLLRRSGEGEGELVEVGHRRHGHKSARPNKVSTSSSAHCRHASRRSSSFAFSVLLAAGAAATGAAPAPFTYVALGDSFSSGEGVAPYLGAATTRCDRSSRAYSTWVRPRGFDATVYALASGGGTPGADNRYGSDANVRTSGPVTWSFWACSGAKARQVLSGAMALEDADLVTLTIGGNDAGYVDVLVQCGLTRCNTAAFRAQRAAKIDALKPTLETTYRAIATQAPHARILVLGYAQPFPARPRRTGVLRPTALRRRAGHAARAREQAQRHDRERSLLGRRGRRQYRVRPGRGQVRRPRGVRAEGTLDDGDQVQQDGLRPRPRLLPSEPEGPARRVRGGRQRGAPLTGGPQPRPRSCRSSVFRVSDRPDGTRREPALPDEDDWFATPDDWFSPEGAPTVGEPDEPLWHEDLDEPPPPAGPPGLGQRQVTVVVAVVAIVAVIALGILAVRWIGGSNGDTGTPVTTASVTTAPATTQATTQTTTTTPAKTTTTPRRRGR